jgi:hypothetical protein
MIGTLSLLRVRLLDDLRDLLLGIFGTSIAACPSSLTLPNGESCGLRLAVNGEEKWNGWVAVIGG